MMARTRTLATSLAATAFLSACSVFGIRGGYEQPAYEVLAEIGDGMEVRRYGARLAAGTQVEGGDPDAARNAAFRILAGYIFGGNRPKASIAMTSPVETQGSAKVAMTAPVATAAGAGATRMRFFLPSELTLETAPEPTDARVRLEIVPSETVAVARYTWLWSVEAEQRAELRLRSALDASGWKAAGAPTTLLYDPPWTIPFLRRNEVVLPVATR